MSEQCARCGAALPPSNAALHALHCPRRRVGEAREAGRPVVAELAARDDDQKEEAAAAAAASLSWVCGACARDNEPGTRACVACGASREGRGGCAAVAGEALEAGPFAGRPLQRRAAERKEESDSDDDDGGGGGELVSSRRNAPPLPSPGDLAVQGAVNGGLFGAVLGGLYGWLSGSGVAAGAAAGAANGAVQGGVLGAGLGVSAQLARERNEQRRRHLREGRIVHVRGVAFRVARGADGRVVISQAGGGGRARGPELDADGGAGYEELLQAFGDGSENRRGLDRAALDELPTRALTAGDVARLPEEAAKCLVCLEEFAEGHELVTLPCFHMLHTRPCAERWLSRHSTCPICRYDLLPSE